MSGLMALINRMLGRQSPEHDSAEQARAEAQQRLHEQRLRLLALDVQIEARRPPRSKRE